MVNLVEASRSPRLGSSAERATYAGPGVRSGAGRWAAERRSPPEDLDLHIIQPGPEGPTRPATLQQPAFDQAGRALPLPPDEERRRAAEAIRALDALASPGDHEEQAETFAALVEAVDQERLSDRRRFGE